MKSVDHQRLLGNFAESYVANMLSAAGCFVRPVAGGTDIGIDLYCETTTVNPESPNNALTPFLHFWVQVKSGAQVRTRDGKAECYFKQADLHYWLRQPIPVFVALVDATWPPSHRPKIWIVDIGSELIVNGLPEGGMSYATALAVAPETNDAMRFLLERHLPAATAMQGCKQGVLMNMPTINQQYVGLTPLMPAARWSPMIAYQLRITSANAIVSMWRIGDLSHPFVLEYRDLMAAVVRACVDHDPKRHWECFLAMGLVAHAKGRHGEAQRYYADAKATILADTQRGPAPQWSRHLGELDDLSAEAGRGAGPTSPPLVHWEEGPSNR